MPNVQFFFGILFSSQVDLKEVEAILTDAFGSLDKPSEVHNFTQTDYYSDEMGQGLKRVFYSINQLLPANEVAKMKIHTIQLENEFFSVNKKRLVNIDPGYLDAVKVVLASTKYGGHKIQVTDKICADMVLDFFKGNFRSFEWSFPDFKSGIYFPYFKELRGKYLEKVN